MQLVLRRRLVHNAFSTRVCQWAIGGRSRPSRGSVDVNVALEHPPFVAAQMHLLGADFRWFHEQVPREGMAGVRACGVAGVPQRVRVFSASPCLSLSLLLSAQDWRSRDRPSGGLTCKITIRNPASGHPRKASTADGKLNHVKEHFSPPPTYFTIKATFNHIDIYFPLWGLTALILFFKEQLPHVGFCFCFTSAVTSPGCRVGRAAPAASLRVGAGPRGWSASTHSGVCAVLGKPIRLSHWLRSQEVDPNGPSESRESSSVGFANLLSFNSSTVYSSWLWTTRVPLFPDSSVTWGIRFWRWAYILLSLST